MSENIAQWVSAIATMAAALVALYIPFRMVKLEQQRTEADHKQAIKEICFTIDTAVNHYLDLRDALLRADANQHATRFSQVSVECKAIAAALDRMLNRDGLSDGPLTAGSAAIELARAVAAGALMAAEGHFLDAIEHQRGFHHLAQLAFSRAERVREYHEIERTDKDRKPVF